MRQILSTLFARLGSDRRGAVAMLFALSLLPLSALTGLAIDYAGVNRTRQAVFSMADSAALAAVSETVVKPSVPKAQQKDVSLAAAKQEWEGLVQAAQAGGTIKTVDFDVQDDGDGISIKVCFTGQQKTTMLSIAGVASLDFTGCSTARSAPPVYVSVYALIDASGSMGIGATYADQSLMERRLGCAFACHTINNVNDHACNTAGGNIARGWWSQTPKCAAVIGAKTRFDIVRDAMMKVADQAATIARVPGQYRLSVHKFSNYLTEVAPSTTNLPTVRSQLTAMTMDQRGAGTNFYKVLPEFARSLPASGDGKSPDRPKVFALILTDGISSRVFEESNCYWNPSLRPNCVFTGSWYWDSPYTLESPFVDGSIRSQAFNPRLCDDIKAKNVTVLTLATEFDSSNINDGHMKSVDRVLRALSLQGLQRCATATNLAYQANSGPDVDRAIRAMFSNVVEKARITR